MRLGEPAAPDVEQDDGIGCHRRKLRESENCVGGRIEQALANPPVTSPRAGWAPVRTRLGSGIRKGRPRGCRGRGRGSDEVLRQPAHLGDVTLTLPPGEISVLLGPSGTGKSVFLKPWSACSSPSRARSSSTTSTSPHCSEHKLYEIRKLFGVLFQDGALFGSMNLFDNIAFPLREHTKKSESEIKRHRPREDGDGRPQGAEKKLPGEISGGMRKRAGLARALVLDPEIILFDEPDSGLDPVRVAYLNQLIVDLNAQTDATFLIVTHDIGTARTVPDNLGMLFRRELVMFGPREVLLT